MELILSEIGWFTNYRQGILQKAWRKAGRKATSRSISCWGWTMVRRTQAVHTPKENYFWELIQNECWLNFRYLKTHSLPNRIPAIALLQQPAGWPLATGLPSAWRDMRMQDYCKTLLWVGAHWPASSWGATGPQGFPEELAFTVTF